MSTIVPLSQLFNLYAELQGDSVLNLLIGRKV